MTIIEIVGGFVLYFAGLVMGFFMYSSICRHKSAGKLIIDDDAMYLFINESEYEYVARCADYIGLSVIRK